MAKENRQVITLECPVCKSRPYQTTKNVKNTTDRLVLKKLCPTCGVVRELKETK